MAARHKLLLPGSIRGRSRAIPERRRGEPERRRGDSVGRRLPRQDGDSRDGDRDGSRGGGRRWRQIPAGRHDGAAAGGKGSEENNVHRVLSVPGGRCDGVGSQESRTRGGERERRVLLAVLPGIVVSIQHIYIPHSALSSLLM